MAQYKFDGATLREGSNTIIANVHGDEIRQGSGSNVIGNIHGDSIRHGSGSNILFNVRGDDLRQGAGSNRIATVKDVDNAIDGPGKIVKAALWLLCCR